MVSKEDLLKILNCVESETLDFKQTGYNLADKDGRISLVKDILAMANTPRKRTSYLVLGVKKFLNGAYEVCGLQDPLDDATMFSVLNEWVTPIPEVHYEPVNFDGATIGLISIEPNRNGPYMPIRPKGNRLDTKVYLRYGSMNKEADASDLRKISEWIQFGDRSLDGDIGNSSNWQNFFQSVGGFDPGGNYFLVSSNQKCGNLDKISILSAIPWKFVIDFDPNSDKNGLAKAIVSELKTQRTVYSVTKGDLPDFNAMHSTYWFYCMGLNEIDSSIPSNDSLKEWRLKYSAEVTDQCRHVARAMPAGPIKCLVLWFTDKYDKQLQKILDALSEAFGDSIDFIAVTDRLDEVNFIEKEDYGKIYKLEIERFCASLYSELSSRLDTEAAHTKKFRFPASNNSTILLESKDQRWLEEYLELIQPANELDAPNNQDSVPCPFRLGAEISWWDIKNDRDVRRQISEKVEAAVKKSLRQSKVDCITINHEPGAGATTIAKRILWNLHDRYPSVQMHSYDAERTVEAIYWIASSTGEPVLILVDGSSITESQVEDLQNRLISRQIPATILQIVRSFDSQRTLPGHFWLESRIDDIDFDKFVDRFSLERPDRENELKRLKSESDPRMRNPFILGLTVYRKNFQMISKYIADRIEGLNEIQTRVLIYFAIAHHYGQQSLNPQMFSRIIGLSPRVSVDLGKIFTSAESKPAFELLLKTTRGELRTVHVIVAEELLKQLITKGMSDTRLYRRGLVSWAEEFMYFCRGEGTAPNLEGIQLASRIFIFRYEKDTSIRDQADKITYSRIIGEIETEDGRCMILTRLTELFPGEAHFWGHLGRFHSELGRNYSEAIRCIDKSLQIQDGDHVLYHMRGMANRNQTYKLFETGENDIEIFTYVEEASKDFEKARQLSPTNDHGYIAEAQLLVRLIEYFKHRDGNTSWQLLNKKDINPLLRESIEKTEHLLEQVRHNNSGKDKKNEYELTVRGSLQNLYGNYIEALQTLDSLLSRPDVYAPPIRRQIVWTHLNKYGNDRPWDSLSQKEIDRCLDLLEENILMEPADARNLRLWLRAFRYAPNRVTPETAINNLAYWNASSDHPPLDGAYYLGILYSLGVLDGHGSDLEMARQFVEQSRRVAINRWNRTFCFEWFGKGHGLQRLIHRSSFGKWDAIDKKFWTDITDIDRLQRVNGRIRNNEKRQAGRIETEFGLPVFFVPARANLTKSSDLNMPVSFYLGFSYDGPIAFNVLPTKTLLDESNREEN